MSFFLSLMTMPLAMLFLNFCCLFINVSILKGWKPSAFLLSFLGYWWFAFRYALRVTWLFLCSSKVCVTLLTLSSLYSFLFQFCTLICSSEKEGINHNAGCHIHANVSSWTACTYSESKGVLYYPNPFNLPTLQTRPHFNWYLNQTSLGFLVM